MYLPDVDRDPPGTYPECLHDGGGVSRNAEETSEPVRIEMPNETSVLRQKCHAINDLENARNRVRIPASRQTSPYRTATYDGSVSFSNPCQPANYPVLSLQLPLVAFLPLEYFSTF
jgi:hypothetical protein